MKYLDPSAKIEYTKRAIAEVAELADARDSKSRTYGYVGSIPTFGTHYNIRRPPIREGGSVLT